jgi:long-chain acyl-CoA synthetase
MTGVNTLFNALMNTPGFGGLDFSALKVVVGGGAAVQKPVAERWKQVTGRYVTEAYGLTETSPGVCANPLGTPWNGAIGLPFPSTDVSIRDDGFNELPVWTGEGDIERHTGEICVRGPQVMKGYWNNPAETAKVMQNGWLKCRGLRHHHRSQERHDPGFRFQRLSERDRERGGDTSGRARVRGGGHSR